ncbi:hypothetical protein D3C85_1901130 [compost metagenome]
MTKALSVTSRVMSSGLMLQRWQWLSRVLQRSPSINEVVERFIDRLSESPVCSHR